MALKNEDRRSFNVSDDDCYCGTCNGELYGLYSICDHRNPVTGTRCERQEHHMLGPHGWWPKHGYCEISWPAKQASSEAIAAYIANGRENNAKRHAPWFQPRKVGFAEILEAQNNNCFACGCFIEDYNGVGIRDYAPIAGAPLGDVVVCDDCYHKGVDA